MKSLSQHIDEKLLINRNFKKTDMNEEFWNSFEEDFQTISNKNWWHKYTGIGRIRALVDAPLSASTFIKLNTSFDEIGSRYIYYTLCNYDELMKMFYNMIKFIINNDDNMKYEVNYTSEKNGLDFYVRVFDINDFRIGLVGPARPSNSAEWAHIIFKFKDKNK